MPNYSEEVDCAEEFVSVSETYDDENGWAARVKLRVAAADRYKLVDDIVGNARPWIGAGDWEEPPFAKSASMEPDATKYTSDGQYIVYEEYLVTINYKRNKEENEELISESLEPTVEFGQLAHTNFKWIDASGDPLTQDEAPGFQKRSLTLVRTIFKVPAPLPVELLTLIGSVNHDAYTSALLGLPFPEETLLYQPPHLERTVKTSGVGAFNIVMRMNFKPEGWNKYYRAKTGAYTEIWNVALAAVQKSYPPNNFSAFLY